MTNSLRSADSFPPATVAELPALTDRARLHDGSAPFADDLWRQAIGGQTVLAATIQQGDQVRGVGFVGRQGERLAAEVLVDPAHRGNGLGTALVTHILDRFDGEVWLWSHADHPGARAIAAAHDLEPARELLQMRRSLVDGPPIPEPSWPEGVAIRPFLIGRDEQAWLDVNNAAFAQHPEQGHMTLDDIRAATKAADFDAAGFFLAFGGPDLLGFHWTKVHSSDPSPQPGASDLGPIGEVYVLGVSPAAHGQGLGSALTAGGLRYLAEQRRMRDVMLYVEGDNIAARKVYERMGFRTYLINVAYRRT